MHLIVVPLQPQKSKQLANGAAATSKKQPHITGATATSNQPENKETEAEKT